MAFARSKFGESLHAGRNKFSTANLFRKLVWDVENAVPMVYKKYEGWACLVSTYRKQFREHRIPYRIFEEAMLEYPSTAHWKSLSQPEEDPKTTELIERREALAREIDDATKVLDRYEAILDDPDTAGLERIVDKYKAAAARLQRLLHERSSLAQLSLRRARGRDSRRRKQPRCNCRYGRPGVYPDRTVLAGTPVAIARADRAAHRTHRSGLVADHAGRE